MAIPFLAPAAALIALAAAAFGYRWRQDIWSWISRTPPPAAAEDRLRVLVAGPTGIGKTTLIRRVVGSDVGEIGEGAPKTAGLEWLGRAGFPVWFADTKGIELVSGAQQQGDIRRKLAAWRPEHRPHLAWLCVQADAARVIDGAAAAEGTEGALARMLDELGVPLLVVITQADEGGEMRAAMEERCRAAFPSARAVIALCAEPRVSRGRVVIAAHGLRALREATLQIAPPALRGTTAIAWPEPPA